MVGHKTQGTFFEDQQKKEMKFFCSRELLPFNLQIGRKKANLDALDCLLQDLMFEMKIENEKLEAFGENVTRFINTGVVSSPRTQKSQERCKMNPNHSVDTHNHVCSSGCLGFQVDFETGLHIKRLPSLRSQNPKKVSSGLQKKEKIHSLLPKCSTFKSL
jgi:hypothetical protein